MSVIQERVIELRKAASVSQKALANAIGVSEIAIQRYEYGMRKPTIDICIALADYFNVSLDYLVGRTDEPTINRKDDNHE